jgi:hypothetical protein
MPAPNWVDFSPLFPRSFPALLLFILLTFFPSLCSSFTLTLDNEKMIIYRRFAGLAGLDYIPPDVMTSPLNLISWDMMDRDGTIDIHTFRADMVQRGFDSHWADAAFHAFDLGKDCRISKYEYYLGILMATQSHKLSQFNDQKWIDFRLKFLFFFYCKADNVSIGYKEMGRFLKDLNSTDDKISTDLLKLDIFSMNWSCSFHEFCQLVTSQEFQPFLNLKSLDISQLNSSPGSSSSSSRHTSGGASQTSSTSCLASANQRRVTLDSRLITTNNTAVVSLKTHVSQTVPTCARAPGLVIDRDLLPQYEWPQSILYTREDNAHKIATFILQQTIGLVQLQLNQEKMDHPSRSSPSLSPLSFLSPSHLTVLLFFPHPLPLAGNIWISKRDIICLLLGTSDRDRHLSYIQILSEAACKIFTAQPTVVNVEPPCKVYGDIHGQFRDLLLLFSRYGLGSPAPLRFLPPPHTVSALLLICALFPFLYYALLNFPSSACLACGLFSLPLLSRYGFPSHRGGDIELCSYVFNGDWVDRGPHQVETVIFLFALKILYPTRVFLVRGNHEFRQQNKNMSRCGSYGFDKACWTVMKGILGNRIFQHIHNAFDMLPLMAVIDHSVAVMHGGLGHGSGPPLLPFSSESDSCTS